MTHLDDDALRALVRESIARHLEKGKPGGSVALVPAGHASHSRYVLPKSEGPCVIEPSVPCNACGYCESHGH